MRFLLINKYPNLYRQMMPGWINNINSKIDSLLFLQYQLQCVAASGITGMNVCIRVIPMSAVAAPRSTSVLLVFSAAVDYKGDGEIIF